MVGFGGLWCFSILLIDRVVLVLSRRVLSSQVHVAERLSLVGGLCAGYAKQKFKDHHPGDKSRWMTKSSCLRAHKEALRRGSACEWVFSCAKGETTFGYKKTPKECHMQKMYAVGMCVDKVAFTDDKQQIKRPVVERVVAIHDANRSDESDSVHVTDPMVPIETDDDIDAQIEIAELEEADDIQLKPPSAGDPPYMRVCCKICTKGLACGRSCISKKKNCKKVPEVNPFCACQYQD